MFTTNDIKSQFKNDMPQEFVVLYWNNKHISVLGTEHTEDSHC